MLTLTLSKGEGVEGGKVLKASTYVKSTFNSP